MIIKIHSTNTFPLLEQIAVLLIVLGFSFLVTFIVLIVVLKDDNMCCFNDHEKLQKLQVNMGEVNDIEEGLADDYADYKPSYWLHGDRDHW